MKFNLIVDPKFRDKIPPLTEAEFRQLEENILEAGEIYEPIRTWNKVIIDGHNRYKIAQRHPEVKWTTKPMTFADEWAALDWMYKNQLGRRNLTEEQKTYMIGKMYEARKNTRGNNAERGADGKYLKGQNVQTGGTRRVTKDGTAGEIGREYGIDARSVRRAEEFAKGIDAIREVSPEAADKILSGESKASKRDVAVIPTLKPEQMQDAAEHILDDIPLNYYGNSSYNRKMKEIANDIVAQMRDVDAPSTYNIDDLIEEITVNGRTWAQAMKNIVSRRKQLIHTAEDKSKVKDALLDIITQFKEAVELL